MALSRLRRFDVQARYAAVLASASVIPCVGAAAVLVWKYDATLGQIVYGAAGKVVPVFLVCVLVSLLPASVSFLLGWNSVGQRQNDKPSRSWIGFFVGGAVVTMDVILMIAFVMLRLEIPK